MKKEREGKRDAYYGRRPTPPISDVKAQRRSGWALSYLGFFSFRSQQDTNEKENTEMEMRKKMPGNKKNNQQVRLSAHRKSTHFSPLDSLFYSTSSDGHGTSLPVKKMSSKFRFFT